MSQPSERDIRRREYLASAGVVVCGVGLAGCSGSSEDSGSNQTPTDESQETSTPTSTETETPTPQTEPSAEVVDSEVFTAPFFSDGTGDSVPWVRVEVENSTTVPHREVRVQTRLRANDDSILATREGFTLLLPPDTTWRYYLRQDASVSIDAISTAENTVLQQETGIRGTVLEEVEILNSSFSVESGVVNITGEVDIGERELSRVTIVGLVRDEEGQFRGAVSAVETNPNATDTIAFDAGLTGFRTPPEAPDPSDYELRIIDGSV